MFILNKMIFSLAAVCLFAASLTIAAPAHGRRDAYSLATRQSSEKLVFCHFMIGIVSNRKSAADYDDDMKRAKSYGIDAFALNIGVDPYTNDQLDRAYQSAENNGMKVFISFDFNWYKDTSQAVDIGNMIKKYGTRKAQLMVGNQVFVSSFAGDKLDIATVRSTSGMGLFVAPNWHPELKTDFTPVDGALNWMAWPNNGNNKAPTAAANVSVSDGDQSYIKALGKKAYIAPVSPWFSTHFGPEVSYSKNWVFPSDLLWYNRWNDILSLGPRFIEIVTWNDYGESHYIGPLSSPHTDDGASKWANDMPHTGWLEMAKPFIAAYKAGTKDVSQYIKNDQLVYWYRPTPRTVNCDSTDTTTVPGGDNSTGNYFNGLPNGAESMADSVFVVSLLTTPGKVTITSGSNVQSFDAPAGASSFTVPMGTGSQKFALDRNGANIFAETSLKDISAECRCGIYNFNAYVGTVPAGPPDNLQPDGLASFTKSLRVSTCQATPSLGSAPQGTSGPKSNVDAQPTPAPATSEAVVSKPAATTPPPMTSTSTALSSPLPSGSSSVVPPGKGRVITSMSQLAPANCLPKGDIWAGPAGSAKPDTCDG